MIRAKSPVMRRRAVIPGECEGFKKDFSGGRNDTLRLCAFPRVIPIRGGSVPLCSF
jgi:hypothetical protein